MFDFLRKFEFQSCSFGTDPQSSHFLVHSTFTPVQCHSCYPSPVCNFPVPVIFHPSPVPPQSFFNPIRFDFFEFHPAKIRAELRRTGLDSSHFVNKFINNTKIPQFQSGSSNFPANPVSFSVRSTLTPLHFHPSQIFYFSVRLYFTPLRFQPSHISVHSVLIFLSSNPQIFGVNWSGVRVDRTEKLTGLAGKF